MARDFETLMKDVKGMHEALMAKTPVRYLRTHATFSNDTKKGGQVVKFNADGTYTYDFNKVNNIYKAYLDNGIKPIVEFDFFPDKFAKSLGSDVNTEGFKGKTAEPRSWEEWETGIGHSKHSDNIPTNLAGHLLEIIN